MPNVDTLMAAETPKFLSAFGQSVKARYYTDADPNNYTEYTLILVPPQDQQLDEGAVDLQYTAQEAMLSVRGNGEGPATIVCHGDTANQNGGDRVKLPDDNYTAFWHVSEVTMVRAGMAQIRIVNNPGAID